MPVTTRTPTAIDAAPSFIGYPPGGLVGGDTAMDASDADTSYAEVSAVGGFGTITGHTFEWEPAGAIPADAVVTLEADWTSDDGGSFFVGFVHPTLGGRTAAVFGPGTFGYTVEQRTVSPAWVTDGEAFLPGVQWAIFSGVGSDLFPTVHAKVTRLALLIETTGTPHLRQRNRDTIRARNLASRQRGIRARGYL